MAASKPAVIGFSGFESTILDSPNSGFVVQLSRV